MAKLLLLDDNAQIRRAVGRHLEKAGHSTKLCANGRLGLEVIKAERFDLVISDLKMPELGGIEFLEALRNKGLDVPVILLTGHGSVDSAVEAMKMGASDYLSKPVQLPELSIRIDRLLERRELHAENQRLRSELQRKFGFETIVGRSAAMKKVFESIRPLAADRDISILINGETGTGKELVAKSVHYTGPRADNPFVAINCGALPEHLLESELFGHEKGAFTDARKEKKGLFEIADGGTLFLDEIDSMPLNVQVTLLRAIEERTIRRVGGTKDLPLDIRLICASSVELSDLVDSGDFRNDLYFRIAVAPVTLPPLRMRDGDILLLAGHFAEKRKQGTSKKLTFSSEVQGLFSEYGWPGNVRELENLIELLSVTNQSGQVEIEDIPPSFRQMTARSEIEESVTDHNDLKSATRSVVDDFERKFILGKLEANRWNISRTAAEIGLSRAALHTKINHLNLKE